MEVLAGPWRAIRSALSGQMAGLMLRSGPAVQPGRVPEADVESALATKPVADARVVGGAVAKVVALNTLEWAVVVALCFRYTPLQKVLQHPRMPVFVADSFGYWVGTTARQAAKINEARPVIWVKETGAWRRWAPSSSISLKEGVGAVAESTLLYYSILPVLFPVNCYLVCNNMGEKSSRGSASSTPSSEDDFESELQAELSRTSFKEWRSSGFDPEGSQTASEREGVQRS